MAGLRRWWGLLLLAGALVPVIVLEPFATGPPIRDESVGTHRWAYALLRGDREPGEFGPAAHTAAQALGALALVVLGWLLLSVCYRLAAPAGMANFALLAVVLGVGLFHAGTHDAAFATIYSALGVGALLWLGVRRMEDEKPFKWSDGLAFGVVVFLLLLVRAGNIVVVAALALVWFFVVVWPHRTGAAPLVGAAVGAVLALSVPGRSSFAWHGPPDTALLVREPVVLVVLLTGLVMRRTRWATLALGGLFLVHVAAFGLRASPFLDDLTPLMPLAVPLFACALAELPWWARRPTLLVAALATAVAVEIMILRWAGMNVKEVGRWLIP
jgi:hypothetical protein